MRGQLPIELAAKDPLGRMSIVEMGFLSLTAARHVATQYAADGSLSTVFKVERGDRSCGACIAGLSYYYREEEVVFPPLTNLQRAGNPTLTFAENGSVVTEVPLVLTVNQHSDTIDQLVERRKFLHMGMLANLDGEVERELQPIDLIVETIKDARQAAAVGGLNGTEADLTSFAERARATCSQRYAEHDATPSLAFNDDEKFSGLVQKGVEMKVDALKINTPGARSTEVLGKWFEHASGVDMRGVAACVNVVGANVFARADVRNPATGVTPLLAASRGGSLEICNALIQAKADVSAADNQGTTALLAASRGGSFAVCDALIQAKADVSAADKQGSTALLAACRGGSFEICDALIQAGTDTAVVRKDGASALAMSIMSGDFKAVALVLGSIACKHHAGITSLQHLAEAFVNPWYISARMSSGASPLCLQVEIGALMATLASMSGDDTEIAWRRHAQGQLGHVRAFLEYHASLLTEPPVAIRQAVSQLASQEPDGVFRADMLGAIEDECHEDNAGGLGDGGAEAMRVIQWVNKPPTRRPCLLTLRGGSTIQGVAYSPDGRTLARAEGDDVVLCCAVSGIETCRLQGHRCCPECLHLLSPGTLGRDIPVQVRAKEHACLTPA